MKTQKFFLFVVFLLTCQSIFAQNLESSITIKVNNGNYIVSGVVTSDAVKNEAIEKIKTRLGDNVEFKNISVQPNAKPFQIDWQIKFDESLSKIKTWKVGVFIFSNKKTLTNTTFPLLSDEILNAQFLLAEGQSYSLKDYKNKVIVLFFLESWCGPCILQAKDLNKFYPKISARNVELIGISVETKADEKNAFRELFKKYDFQFKFGWTDKKMLQNFIEITKLNAIPQVFIILNGRLHSVFIGGSPRVTAKFEETILEVLDKNNL